MALIDQIEIESVFVDSAVRGENSVGIPVDSAVPLGTGEELADEYTLLLSAVSGGTGTVAVSTSSANNPWDGRIVSSVPLDGATVVGNIIPGVGIVFDAGAESDDEAIIYVGEYKGTFDASGVGAGTPGAGVRHKVVNNGSSEINNCKARLLTQAVLVKKTGDVFGSISSFAEDAVEKVAGGGSNRVMPYEMTIDNVTGTGASKVADLLIDGVNFGTDSIQDLTTAALSNGTGLKALETPYPYAVVDGPLKGLTFSLHEDCVDSDSSNILIFPSRYVQIATDFAGSEGTYGVVDVTLTQSGQSSGVILASGSAYYWVRILVPQSANNESNPYPANVALQGSESQDAGWTE